MKIEIAQNKVQREPVAYIDRDGDLVMKTRYERDGAVLLGLDIELCSWDPDCEAKTLLYPGDKVTITF